MKGWILAVFLVVSIIGVPTAAIFFRIGVESDSYSEFYKRMNDGNCQLIEIRNQSMRDYPSYAEYKCGNGVTESWE